MNQLTKKLNALGNPVRMRIVRTLLEKDCCLGSLSRKMEMNKEDVKEHLQILLDSDIVFIEQTAHHRHNVVNKTVLNNIVSDLSELSNTQTNKAEDNHHCS